MDVAQLVRNEERENRHLAYAPKHLDRCREVEILVGMANVEGGTVVVGVRVDEDGRPSGFEDVDCPEYVVDDIESDVREAVEPGLDFREELLLFEKHRLLAFTVPPAERIRSYVLEEVEKPVFPVRRRTGMEYLSGQDIPHYTNLSVSV